MFVVLKIINPEKGFLKRRKQKKALDNAVLRSCPTEKGLPFYILEVLDGKRGINWKLAADKCGRYSSRIIAPRSLPLPDHARLKRFIPISMNSVLVFNTALKIIEKSKLVPDEICITLTDRNGVHPRDVCKILPYASTVRVVTNHPERYAASCSEAFEEHGASLIIRNAYEPISKPDIVICCDGAVTASMKNAAIFTSKRKNGGKLVFSGSGVCLAPKHAEIISPETDPVDFAGALTELCGSREYKNAVFSQIEATCRKCEDSPPEKCLECCCLGRINT